jgi:malate dehydrogenase (quinone)
MSLSENPELFREIHESTAQVLGLSEAENQKELAYN